MSEPLKVNAQRGTYKEIHASKVVVPRAGERCRKDFTGTGELAESIAKFGLDNPVTVCPSQAELGKYELIAGERRFRALLSLGIQLIPVIIRADMDEAHRKEFELEENLQRKELEWPERIEGERQLDEIKKRLHPGWEQKDTAKVLGTSATTASKEITFARELAERPELKEAVKHLPIHAAIRRVERIKEAEKLTRESTGRAACGAMRRGDARELLKGVEPGSVGLVLTDPPFGIEQIEKNRGDGKGGSNAQTQGLSDADNSTAEGVRAMYQWLLPEIERVLASGGHFYIFTCQQQWSALRAAVLSAKLELQEYPIIWYKGKTTAPGRGWVWQPCCEPVMFGWKPPKRRMLETNAAALVEVKPVSPTNGIHAYQKPLELCKLFIKQSSLMGELVLDPFAGSGSVVVAAIKLGRTGLGFDLDPEGRVFPLAVKRVEKALKERESVQSRSGNGEAENE